MVDWDWAGSTASRNPSANASIVQDDMMVGRKRNSHSVIRRCVSHVFLICSGTYIWALDGRWVLITAFMCGRCQALPKLPKSGTSSDAKA